MGTPQERTLAKLSITAFIIDLVIVLAICKLGYDILFDVRWSKQNGMLQFVFEWYPAVIPLALILHLFVVEVLLSGNSAGRFFCGLSVAQVPPAKSSIVWRAKRFLSILTRFGLGSLNPNRLPGYNRAEDLVFKSDIAGAAVSAPKTPSAPVRTPVPSRRQDDRSVHAPTASPHKFRLDILKGPHKGQTVALAEGRNFAKQGIFRIGRDPAWADLVLDKDPRISSRHCILSFRNGQLTITDGNGEGRASTNGISVAGKPIDSGMTLRINIGAVISIGNSEIGIV